MRRQLCKSRARHLLVADPEVNSVARDNDGHEQLGNHGEGEHEFLLGDLTAPVPFLQKGYGQEQ